MQSTMSNSIHSTPRGRRCRQLAVALAALAALSTVASTAQAKTSHRHSSVVRSAAHHGKKAAKPAASPRNPYAGLANYAAGFMTTGNNVPQGGDRYQPGFAGFADYASGYMASHPAS
jgi:hypothetical protein